MGEKKIGPDTLSQIIEEVSRIVTRETGNHLNQSHEIMIGSRLTKRIHELGLQTQEEYLQHLRTHEVEEVPALVSLITTHHTYFFREFFHFEFLLSEGLQKMIDGARKEGRKKLRIWSAACSKGQEVYSLSMFLSHHLPVLAPDFTFEVFGSDVDQQCVTHAKNGVYLWSDLKSCPSVYLGKNWTRGTGDIAQFVKANSEMKNRCHFHVNNLAQLQGSYLQEGFDLVFCRNVFLYFSPPQIRSITENLFRYIKPHGYLMVGLSESLNDLKLPIVSKGPAIYQHKLKDTPLNSPAKTTAAAPTAPLRSVAPAMPAIKKVICVDDSPTVLKILQMILVKEHGFEVVATAKSGLDAQDKMKTLKADLMTLDIHMPEMGGLEYLRQNFKPGHPPVLIVSSVQRDDKALADEAIKLGASDFVEKPNMSQMKECGDEIRTKLKLLSPSSRESFLEFQNAERAGSDRKAPSATSSSATNKSSGKIPLRVVILESSQMVSQKRALREITRSSIKTLWLFTDQDFASREAELQGFGCKALPAGTTPLNISALANHSWGHFQDFWSQLSTLEQNTLCSVLVCTDKASADRLKGLRTSQVIVEEQLTKNSLYRDVADDFSPFTSFVYLSETYLRGGK